MTASIRAHDLGVRFQFDRHRRVVTPTLAHLRLRGRTAWGLRNIGLQIDAGEGVALIGPTGSGKTSLLRVLAGILPVDEGTLQVKGRIGTLLSPQAGLLTLLTGSENAEMLGVLSGFSTRESRASLPEIKRVTGLGEAFEQTVSTYSQGMRARLGFAASTHGDIDVLLLDEVQEALDHEFRSVVAKRAREIRERGGIVVAAGHDHTALSPICDRAVLLRAGRIEADGEFGAILEAHLSGGAPG